MNRSLRKIQTVLDSVEGVEGGLQFDPTTGELVPARSVVRDPDAHKTLFMSSKCIAAKKCEISDFKVRNDSYISGNQAVQGLSVLDSENRKQVEKKSSNSVEEMRKSDFNMGLRSDRNQYCHLRAVQSEMENDDGLIEHNQATSSSMTDSSNASGSLSSSPNSNDKQRQPKDRTSNESSGSRITIKATYNEDTIRFKFEPSAGCLHLYEEVATRFKIQRGTFQLKYLDDEEEWVMLVSDSDLQECLEIMEYMGKNSLKFLVRDLAFGMGSSAGSNGFLPGSC